jgi:hypothetical protein
MGTPPQSRKTPERREMAQNSEQEKVLHSGEITTQG